MANYTGIDNLEIMEEAVNYNRHLTSFVTQVVKDKAVLLDFGAGTGTFAKVFERLGYKVHCIESDSLLLDKIKSEGINAYPCITNFVGNVDAIYSFNVLEHIEADEKIISELSEKVSNDGYLIVYVPAFQSLFSSMDEKVGHVRRYSRRELVQKMERAGLVVLQANYIDSLGFFAALLFKYLGNDAGNINRSSLKFYDNCVFPLSAILDKITGSFFGKNLLVVAQKRVGNAVPQE